jgi:hypothetical protein
LVIAGAFGVGWITKAIYLYATPNMINVVAFIDEAMNLTEEEVGEIAEIINEYLNKKHGQSL